MQNTSNFYLIAGWLFGLLIFTIGILNLFLIHPVPGLAYIILSMIFLPPVNSFLLANFGFKVPWFLKIILGIVILWFTLGVSDLADMYGL